MAFMLDHSAIDGFVQDCSNSSAVAMELLQSCTKPSIYGYGVWINILMQLMIHW